MRLPACALGLRDRTCRLSGPKARDGKPTNAAFFLLPISSSPAMLHDAVVIGAGPAGSAAARLLAEAGWHVALVEKAEFPRRKVCGEFISATSVPVLKACGVAACFIAEAGPPVTRLGIYAGNSVVTQRREQVWGRALGREHLDLMLRDAAVAAGAELCEPAEVMGLAHDNGVWTCALDDGRRLAARTVIAACG